jgi:hypothetical protein
VHAIIARQIQGHATKAAADVEHAVARPQIELGGNVALLGFLRVLERELPVGEVRT